MRLVSGFLAFWGWKYIYLVIIDTDKYLENASDPRTIFYMIILVLYLMLLTMGAILGRVPKKFTNATREYDKQRKKS